VPHHLLDLVAPAEDFSLAEYLDAAHDKIRDIQGRGKEVLFVGGTALYLKSLLRGVYQGPPPDWEFREAIEKELALVGLPELHKRLQVIDPLLAAKLHPNDKRRIIRALEVFRVTGEPLSHRQTHFDEGRPASECKVFVLSWPREELHERIDARVESMFAAGLVNEVRGLIAAHGLLSRTASQAVGYREVMEYLAQPPGSPDSLAECIDLVKARTRQFARRQETWFRGLSECTFVPQSAEQSPSDVAANILDLLERRAPTS
jgi:tRNA dimethylallyltransferase